MSRDELASHIDAIERSYEFFLAYAAQGAVDDATSRVGAQLRDFLECMENALEALATELPGIVAREGLEPPETYGEMTALTAGDAARALTAVRLVRSRPSIGSQLIDNLNASLHVRALLTDLFLLDETI